MFVDHNNEGFEDDGLASCIIDRFRDAFVGPETGRDDARESSVVLFSVTELLNTNLLN